MATLTDAQKKKIVTIEGLAEFKANLVDEVNVPVYTTAEYEANKSTIPVGTQFIISDDYEEGAGGSGSSYDMVNSIQGVLNSKETSNKVVNAFTISNFSNVYTEMVGAILTKGHNTIGKWFAADETWDTSLMLQDDRFIEHENEQLSFEFDFWVGEAQGDNFKANSSPLHLAGYQWDSTAGALTIKCAETAPNDITVIIKVTHIRERSE